MTVFKLFSSTSLRFKILFGLLLSLLPMLVIVGINYYTARSGALKNSERIMRLITQNGAREINAFIKAQESTFSDWTAEDIFGMAIEFQTTDEVQKHMESLIKGQRGFSLLMLTNAGGQVLEAAVADHIKDARPEMFRGQTISGANGLMNQGIRSATLVGSDFVKQLGQKSQATYLFAFNTKDSTGKPNGLFLGYLDWGNLQNTVRAVFNEMRTNGFDNAETAILDTGSSMILGHSNEETTGSRLEADDTFMSWLKGAEGGEVRKFDLGEKTDYVTCELVQPAAGLFNRSTAAGAGSSLCLTAFVPENDIMAAVQRIVYTSVGIGGVSAGLIVMIGLFIVGLISRPLNRAIEGLTETAEQVTTGSSQVASASQAVAEGSAEQAASLEETSSSLEEMASMTRQNADNANQADKLMQDANQVVGKANNSMTDLTTSMEEISKASEETSKIIKTIDEIAFQTNLLALNAAVEAARAGEAGAGFAVVADEVRNLAMRAADAAKNTADLIEGTVKKIKDGSEIVTSTNEAFTEVAQSASKVGELVGEIAAASNEQAQGIDQVNRGVNEMDKVVQRAAANSEESAATSEEMNAQAQKMYGNVRGLISLVTGRKNDDHATRSHREVETTVATGVSDATERVLGRPAKTEVQAEQVVVPQGKEVKPDDVIPMEDNDDEEGADFKDF